MCSKYYMVTFRRTSLIDTKYTSFDEIMKLINVNDVKVNFMISLTTLC